MCRYDLCLERQFISMTPQEPSDQRTVSHQKSSFMARIRVEHSQPVGRRCLQRGTIKMLAREVTMLWQHEAAR